MNLIVLLLCIASFTFSMEKNNNFPQIPDIPDEMKNEGYQAIIKTVTCLPIELQKKVLHHYYEEYYLPEIDAYGIVKNINNQPEEKKQLWQEIKKSNSNHSKKCHNRIPKELLVQEDGFEALDNEWFKHDELEMLGDYALGPNKNGLLYFPQYENFMIQDAIHSINPHLENFDITCIHPHKNKYIRSLTDDDYTIIEQYSFDKDYDHATKDYQIKIPGMLFYVDYDKLAESENLIGVDSCRTVVTINTQDTQNIKISKITTVQDLLQGMYHHEENKPFPHISRLEISKKYPHLLLVSVDCRTQGIKSFLCDTRCHTALPIKKFDCPVGFLQPINSLSSVKSFNLVTQDRYELYENILTIYPAQQFITNKLSELRAVVPLILEKWQTIAQLFKKHTHSNQSDNHDKN